MAHLEISFKMVQTEIEPFNSEISNCHQYLKVLSPNFQFIDSIKEKKNNPIGNMEIEPYNWRKCVFFLNNSPKNDYFWKITQHRH